MKTRVIFNFFIASLVVSVLFLVPIYAQNQKETSIKKTKEGETIIYKKPTDKLRTCMHSDVIQRKVTIRKKADQAAIRAGKQPKLLNTLALGTNPREGQYRAEMERLLRIEINNIKKAVEDVDRKHLELTKLFRQLQNYQEITLEYVPGAWKDGEYVISKSVIAIHYDKSKMDEISKIMNDINADKKKIPISVTCVVLDSFTRSVYNTDQWTRKIVRLYYPNVEFIELHTERHNFKMLGTIDTASPEIQLKAMRLVYNNLRAALYSMDMTIAAYYDLREKQNSWQINF